MTRAKEAAIKLRFKRNKKEYEKRDVMGSEALWVGGCAWMGHAVGPCSLKSPNPRYLLWYTNEKFTLGGVNF